MKNEIAIQLNVDARAKPGEPIVICSPQDYTRLREFFPRYFKTMEPVLKPDGTRTEFVRQIGEWNPTT